MSETFQSPDLLLESATDLTHSVIRSMKAKWTEESHVEQGWGPVRKGRCRYTTATAHTRVATIPATSPSTGLWSWSSDSDRTSILVHSRWGPNTLFLPYYWPGGELNDSKLFHWSRHSFTGTSAFSPKYATFPQKESPVPVAQHYGTREDNLLAWGAPNAPALGKKKQEQSKTYLRNRMANYLFMAKVIKHSRNIIIQS